MDLSYSPEEEAFRARVRAWLGANVPPPGTTDDLEALDSLPVRAPDLQTTVPAEANAVLLDVTMTSDAAACVKFTGGQPRNAPWWSLFPTGGPPYVFSSAVSLPLDVPVHAIVVVPIQDGEGTIGEIE